MDQVRQIRLLIAPFVFIFLLGWLAHCDGYSVLSGIEPNSQGFATLLSAAVAVLPLGFLIGTISIAFLTAVFVLVGKYTYETSVRDSAALWQVIGLPNDLPINKENEFYAQVTLDHSVIDKNIHAWTVRRWTSFNIHLHCLAAMLIAYIIAYLFLTKTGHMNWHLYRPTLLVSAVIWLALLFQAIRSWRQSIGMLEFQCVRQRNKIRERGLEVS